MSKQTINIGASPNDGTGTPLRTSFDYTNQNFTELYTALGGGVGLPGATTQVIFNDGGTNLAGDAGLVYNKTTDTLTAGNATITGALTVATNVLVANAAGYTSKVGIATATPADFLEVVGSGADGIRVSRAGLPTQFATLSAGATGPTLNASSALGSLTFGIAGTAATAMTLNSTGLGVGDAPATKIFAKVTPPGAGQDGMRVSDGTRLIQMSISGSTYAYQGIAANQNVIYASGNPLSILSDAQNLRLGTSSASYLLLDTSGNLGIGVTPNTWTIGQHILIGGTAGAFHYGANGQAISGINAYYNSGWKYAVNGAASNYEQSNGSHVWYNAPVGIAGNTATFTQAMSLNPTGNLVFPTGKGIDFSAVTGGTGTATANVLNDYEEGTFTPTIAGNTIAGVGVYSDQYGRYTKVGRLVTCQIFLNWTAHTGTGNMLIEGLPFATASISGIYHPATIGWANNIALTAGYVITGYAGHNASTIISLQQYPTGGGAMIAVPIDTLGGFIVSISYIT